jgi:polyferredoxin
MAKRAAVAAAFACTAGILILARWKAPFSILLADRFYPGAGWIEVQVLGLLVAVGFGVLSLAAMAVLSTRWGVMVHCTSICPPGVAGNLLGKISPFRIRIGDSCNECGRCSVNCRYNALSPEQVKRRCPCMLFFWA